jgi:hypothetical protein
MEIEQLLLSERGGSYMGTTKGGEVVTDYQAIIMRFNNYDLYTFIDHLLPVLSCKADRD